MNNSRSLIAKLLDLWAILVGRVKLTTVDSVNEGDDDRCT